MQWNLTFQITFNSSYQNCSVVTQPPQQKYHLIYFMYKIVLLCYSVTGNLAASYFHVNLLDF